VSLVYQVEHAGSVRTLTCKLRALAFLWLRPPRSDTKLFSSKSLVSLKELVIPIAVVKDLGLGL
jgi:hypothetical protein